MMLSRKGSKNAKGLPEKVALLRVYAYSSQPGCFILLMRQHLPIYSVACFPEAAIAGKTAFPRVILTRSMLHADSMLQQSYAITVEYEFGSALSIVVSRRSLRTALRCAVEEAEKLTGTTKRSDRVTN
jgi:hypothetical protein